VTALLLLLTACSPAALLLGDGSSTDIPGGSTWSTTTPTSTDSGVPTSSSTDSGTTTAPTTSPTTDTGEPGVVDCSDLPETVVEINEVVGARGYHDVAFDPDGWILGSDNSSLVRADASGVTDIWVPGLGMLEQMDWLHDGDLVISRQQGSLTRVSPEGGTQILATDVYAYEVNVAPDGMIWVANNSQIMRIDPDTGEKERLQIGGIQGGPRLLAFSLDYQTLFVGVLSSGRLFRVALDEDMNPAGAAEVFAGGMGQSYMDGMALDVCGNIYVTEYSNSQLFRVSPDGEVHRLWDPPLNQYGHGLKWGTGAHGWRSDALYIPRPYGNNTVAEVVVGVPGRGWEGKVINKSAGR